MREVYLPAKNTSFSFYVLFFIISQSILIGYLLYQEKDTEREHLSNLIKQRKAEYNSIISSHERLTRTIFEEVINTPDVLQIVDDSFSLVESKRGINRTKLYNKILPSYERLKKDRIRQLHFHFPDGTSLLRIHKPKMFGDNLLKVRSSVRLVNQTHEYIQGFEAGRSYHAFRNVFPLFYANKHIGSVEISIPFYLLRQGLLDAFPAESLFIIKQSIISKKLFKHNLVNYQSSGVIDDFLVEKADLLEKDTFSHEKHIENNTIQVINTKLKKLVSARAKEEKPFAVVKFIGGKAYVVSFLPVKNFDEEVVGYIVQYLEDYMLTWQHRNYLITYSMVTLLMFLLLGLYWRSTKNIFSHNSFLIDVIESLPHPFYVIDAKNYTLKIANSKVASNGQWREKTCHSLTHNNDSPCQETNHQCPLQEVKKSKKEVILEHVHINSKGEKIQVEVHGCPVFDERGNVVQMIEYSIDVTERKLVEQEREKLISQLQEALSQVKQLSGFIPICASCKNIRDDQGYWKQVEQYITDHSDAKFSHSVCPDCANKLYPDFIDENGKVKTRS